MFDLSLFQLVFWLIVAHALCDYPLQGQFLAEAKNRNTEIGKSIWGWALTSHAFIHGGAVAYVTGSIVLGMAEVVVHAVVDFLKCERKIGFHTDQIIHLVFKLLWAIIAVNAGQAA
jgi:hypothetical protein